MLIFRAETRYPNMPHLHGQFMAILMPLLGQRLHGQYALLNLGKKRLEIMAMVLPGAGGNRDPPEVFA
jgi:hypothetical protein